MLVVWAFPELGYFSPKDAVSWPSHDQKGNDFKPSMEPKVFSEIVITSLKSLNQNLSLGEIR